MSQKLNKNSHKGLLKKLTGHVVRGKFCHRSENRQEMESKDWLDFHCGKRLTVSILITPKVQCFSILSMIWRANKSKSSSAYCMLGVWTSTETMRNSSTAKQMLWVSISVDEALASYTCWSFTCCSTEFFSPSYGKIIVCMPVSLYKCSTSLLPKNCLRL